MAILLLIFAAVSGPEWLDRDKSGFSTPESIFGSAGLEVVGARPGDADHHPRAAARDRLLRPGVPAGVARRAGSAEEPGEVVGCGAAQNRAASRPAARPPPAPAPRGMSAPPYGTSTSLRPGARLWSRSHARSRPARAAAARRRRSICRRRRGRPSRGRRRPLTSSGAKLVWPRISPRRAADRRRRQLGRRAGRLADLDQPPATRDRAQRRDGRRAPERIEDHVEGAAAGLLQRRRQLLPVRSSSRAAISAELLGARERPRRARPAATTRPAPSSFAACTAMWPRTPVAPSTSTRSPAAGRPARRAAARRRGRRSRARPRRRRRSRPGSRIVFCGSTRVRSKSLYYIILYYIILYYIILYYIILYYIILYYIILYYIILYYIILYYIILYYIILYYIILYYIILYYIILYYIILYYIILYYIILYYIILYYIILYYIILYYIILYYIILYYIILYPPTKVSRHSFLV